MMGGPAGTHLLRSLTSAVVLDGNGDVELERETRGAPIEWGGVYGQLVRLTGPWRFTIDTGQVVLPLPGGRATATAVGELFQSAHRWGDLEASQWVAPIADAPGAVRTVRLSSRANASARVRLESELVPYLLPVLVEGIRPTEYQVETRADEVRIRHKGFGLSIRSSVAPSYLLLNGASWRGGRYSGPVDRFASVHELDLAPGGTAEASLSVIGGLERELDRATTDPLPQPIATAEATARIDASWLAATPRMRLPDAPELERGYNLARLALRRLYTSPGDDLTGLVAGYPWYASIWGRDLAWMLPAVIWLGDYDWAARSLASVFRFQDRAELPMLGGEPGELPMQLSPGPIFLYGTSDTTLYFPDLVLRLLRHSGRPELVGAWGSNVDRIVAWGRHRTQEATGLLRNGGEAAAIEAATASIAKVRYGIDAVDTTIWDSADRRDHAIDVQVLWWGALRAALDLAGPLGCQSDRTEIAGLAERLAATIRTVYPWPEESYLYDSVRENRPVRELRPNALRAVSAGIFDPPTARSIVERAARDDLSTPWGVRTLSSRDPHYSPEAYHGGQVWTIATAWAGDAAFAVDDGTLGVDYLARIAHRLIEEGGEANECYRGDRPEPFDSCFLLGLSVAPFLTACFEGLWGLSVDARVPRLGLKPQFPPGWKSASLEGLPIGGGRATIDLAGETLRVRWEGDRPLQVEGPVGPVTVPPGGRAELRRPATRPPSAPGGPSTIDGGRPPVP
jgi:glycogen debranching enzyme